MNNETDLQSDAQKEGGFQIEALVSMLVRNWLLILTATLICSLYGLVLALSTPPVYSADALVQIETKASGLAGLGELMQGLDDTVETAAEIEIIRSRTLVGRVVDDLNLRLVVEPMQFPVIGTYLARRNASAVTPVAPVLGLSGFAWGGEQIKVDRLVLMGDQDNGSFVLEAEAGNAFALYSDKKQLLARGAIGQVVKQVDGGTAVSNGLEIFVSQLRARPGTRFSVSLKPAADAVQQFRDNLKIIQVRNTRNMVSMTMTDGDREAVARKLNTLADMYVRQNVDQQSQEAQKSLEFLDAQLPDLRKQLDSSEQALFAFRQDKGAIDLSFETQQVLQQSLQIETQIRELLAKQQDLRRFYSDEHPALVTLNGEIRRLAGQRADLEKQTNNLPATERQLLGLQRDVTLTTELYTSLLNKSQELRVAKAGVVGNARVVDYAQVPRIPFGPNRIQILILSLLGGFILGMAIAVGIESTRNDIKAPADVEKKTQMPLYGSIPHSGRQNEMEQGTITPLSVSASLLANSHPNDAAVEGIRSLRTSLFFAARDPDRVGARVVMVTSSRPGSGKSFLSMNLAYLFAEGGQRTLLIEADMRLGELGRRMKIESSPGLSEHLSGQMAFEASLRRHPELPFDFILRGKSPPNPAELLMSSSFTDMINRLRGAYDLIIIDCPPILPVTDASIVSGLADVSLMVIRSRRNTVPEVNNSVRKLQQGGATSIGAVLNDIRAADIYGYYGYYGYYSYGGKDGKKGTRRKKAYHDSL